MSEAIYMYIKDDIRYTRELHNGEIDIAPEGVKWKN